MSLCNVLATPMRAAATYPRASALLHDLPGLTPYKAALDWQRSLFQARTEGPPAASHPNLVIALEHSPVYTLGRAASTSDLRFPPSSQQQPPLPLPAAGEGSEEQPLPLAPPGFCVHHVERGGKVTYHGPGQLVVYPLLDLRSFRCDLHWYVEGIEEVVIESARRALGLQAFRLRGSPGVWVGQPGSERKFAAVGVNCSKWFTQHGFAINVCPNLAHFEHIVPCGIRDRAVTSLAAEAALAGLGSSSSSSSSLTVQGFKGHVLQAFSEVFHCDLVREVAPAAQQQQQQQHE